MTIPVLLTAFAFMHHQICPLKHRVIGQISICEGSVRLRDVTLTLNMGDKSRWPMSPQPSHGGMKRVFMPARTPGNPPKSTMQIQLPELLFSLSKPDVFGDNTVLRPRGGFNWCQALLLSTNNPLSAAQHRPTADFSEQETVSERLGYLFSRFSCCFGYF